MFDPLVASVGDRITEALSFAAVRADMRTYFPKLPLPRPTNAASPNPPDCKGARLRESSGMTPEPNLIGRRLREMSDGLDHGHEPCAEEIGLQSAVLDPAGSDGGDERGRRREGGPAHRALAGASA